MLKPLFLFRRFILYFSLAVLTINGVAAIAIPIALGQTRLLHLYTFLYFLALGIAWLVVYLIPRRRASIMAVVILAAVIGWAFFGGRPTAPDALRQTYRDSLLSFRGTKYVFGGESKIGIDCSGLARVAFMQAMVVQGLKDANPRLLGPTLWNFWWNDISAAAMLDGIFGYTKLVGHAERLSLENSIRMKPGYTLMEGDLAVTDSGAHVMIYVGDGKWIEASPQDLLVVDNKALNSNRGYFKTPVTIVRWWLLE